MPALLIQRAEASDAQACIVTLRASIEHLCVLDHGHDPERLIPWLANKTVENFQVWIRTPDLLCFSAHSSSAVCGFAMARCEGEILLNYVDPQFRLHGVSTALLAHLESELATRGITDACLTSTQTAHRFYLARGWRDRGRAVLDQGLIAQPMQKRLTAPGLRTG
jgi:GNAT superfamily N-acetyltransferase